MRMQRSSMANSIKLTAVGLDDAPGAFSVSRDEGVVSLRDLGVDQATHRQNLFLQRL